MEMFDSGKLNKILGKAVFKTSHASNDEVVAATGLTIEQLVRGFIFSSRNGFIDELRRWRETGQPMRVDKVFAQKRNKRFSKQEVCLY